MSGHIKGLLGGLASAVTAISGFNAGIENVRDVGDEAVDLSTQLGDQAVNRSRFRPFAITSATGGVTAGEGGNIDLGLNAGAASLRDQLTGTASNLFSRVGASTADREQSIFDKLEALQGGSRSRDRLALEERLFSQGRSGLRTDAFGGAPEQLALEKAIQESQLGSAVQSISLAGQEQQREATIGQGLFQSSFLPEEMLLKLLQGGTQVSDLIGTGNRQGAQLAAALGQTGIEAKIGAESVAARLKQEQINSITELLLGNSETGVTGLFDQFFSGGGDSGGSDPLAAVLAAVQSGSFGTPTG